MTHTNRYIWFDLIRGLSALAVCAGHLRAAMFVDLARVPGASAGAKAFYAATSLGHDAVMVFFVLSGFFVGGAVMRRGAAFQWVDYGVARLSRLWTVLVPALVLTAAVDAVTGSVASGVIAGQDYPVLMSGPTAGYSITWTTFAGNIAFLQTVFVPVYGSNGPLWSLTNEFWYYVAFPLLVIVGMSVQSRRSRLEGVLSLVLVSVVGMAFGASLAIGFAIWSLGALLWVVKDQIPCVGTGLRAGAAVLFVGALGVVRVAGILPAVLPSDIVVGLAFGVFAATLLHDGEVATRRPHLAAGARWLSEISYSLYLSHFPLVVLLYATVYKSRQQVVGAASLAEYVLILCALLAFGWAFWWVFESRTQSLRRVLLRVVRLRARAALVAE